MYTKAVPVLVSRETPRRVVPAFSNAHADAWAERLNRHVSEIRLAFEGETLDLSALPCWVTALVCRAHGWDTGNTTGNSFLYYAVEAGQHEQA